MGEEEEPFKLKWPVKGRVLFFTFGWAFFKHFSLLYYYCFLIGNTLYFVCVCVCVLHWICFVCFENFCICDMLTWFFCLGIHFNTWIKNFIIKFLKYFWKAFSDYFRLLACSFLIKKHIWEILQIKAISLCALSGVMQFYWNFLSLQFVSDAQCGQHREDPVKKRIHSFLLPFSLYLLRSALCFAILLVLGI